MYVVQMPGNGVVQLLRGDTSQCMVGKAAGRGTYGANKRKGKGAGMGSRCCIVQMGTSVKVCV